jgi:glycosyltransferase involved in cell wall biosynthesis
MFQLLREWPPGYGGVERVAHELAEAWVSQGHSVTAFSLRPRPQPPLDHSFLSVHYHRVWLSSLQFHRFILPLPCRALIRVLFSSESLHVHLPCPTLLVLGLLARLIRPGRVISLHWHAFLDPSSTLVGRLFTVYQCLVQRMLPAFSFVVTTSPVLKAELVLNGAQPDSIRVLPCSLPASLESSAKSVASVHLAMPRQSGLRIICIGRLDSYKRVDWVINALHIVHANIVNGEYVLRLDIVGDGPDRARLEAQASFGIPGLVHFHGRVDEITKLALLARADVLVLAADCCNEAFGIVQLEAMACGVLAVSLRQARSGSAWVSAVPTLPWTGLLSDLPTLLLHLASSPDLLYRSRSRAYQRYQEVFARSVWMERLQDAFAPPAAH